MSAFAQEWQDWHHRHEAVRADPHGFLAVTGLYWLDTEPQRHPGAPGRWHTGPEGPVVDLDPGEVLLVEGHDVTGRHAFGALEERGGVTATWGDAVLEVARRGGHDVLRPRHPDHPLRRDYAGTPAYDPDPAWAVPGRFTRFATPRPTAVGSVVDGLEHVYDAVGEIEVVLSGTPLRLLAFAGGAGSLLVLFRDATSGVTTYAANRSVSVPTPSPDPAGADGASSAGGAGAVVVDFNRATNLPCAYTPYATCPLPPAQNDLPVAVGAGERIPA